METINLLMAIAGILLIPLLPAFVIYRYLPSKTVVKGPFKGMDVNLTGAFSGYFLLVLISLGFAYSLLHNNLMKNLEEANAINASLVKQVAELENSILSEKTRFQAWEMYGTIESQNPELTKIFIDVENININAVGRFKASLLLQRDHKQRIHLPNAICFFNKGEGYSVLDLHQKESVSIDTVDHKIDIKEKIKLQFPVKYVSQAGQPNPTLWNR